MSKINNILSKLKKVRKTGNDRWVACCPAHDDKTPSLALRVVDNKILLKCFVGCGAHDIVDAVGLSLNDLFLDNNCNYERSPIKNPISAEDALLCVQRASMVVLINANRLLRGEHIDRDSLVAAISVINNAYER